MVKATFDIAISSGAHASTPTVRGIAVLLAAARLG
jgi:hypothetical protein